MIHPCFRPLLPLALLLLAARGQVFINEVNTWNDRGIADADGRRGDWIELRNFGAEPMDLAGYGLSDDPEQPMKWVLPSKTVASTGHLLVYASGKNRLTGTQLHTNFKLRSSGDRLFLTMPDGKRADEATVQPANVPDVSQGRLESGGWGFFAKPTPGTPNAVDTFAGITPPPRLSHPSGFHATEFLLTLTGEASTELRYTLDGSEPSKDSPLYAEPLAIKDRSAEPNGISEIKGTSIANQHTNGWFPPNGLVAKGTVVRARAFREGYLPSAMITANFFIGINQTERYRLPVITLTTPPEGLFDHVKGIYVLGKVYEDWRKANPREALTGHTPSNYTQRGANWARSAYFEFFEPNGQRGVAMNVTIDIQGQSSRSFRQKSLGVNPRGDLSPTGTIDYPIFPGLRKRGSGEPVEKLNGLRMRNSGNDWDYTMFRDALCHRLAEPLGLDIQASRPCVVFLNGEFWGLYDVREQLEREHLEKHYDVEADQIAILETDAVLKEGKSGDEQHYRTLRSFLSSADMTLPESLEKAATMMDVDNFMNYFLAEIYLGNADWPHNNIRYWRLKTAHDPAASAGRDGRWRWIMFDVDLGYSHPWSQGLAENSLNSATNLNGRNGDAPWSTAMMRYLLRSPQFKGDFIDHMADYLNSVFSARRATTMVDEMQVVVEPVMAEHIKRWRTSSNSISTWRTNVRTMRTFATQRPQTVRGHFNSKFTLGGYSNLTINVSPPGAGQVRVNSLLLNAHTPGVYAPVYPWQGTYFKTRPVRLHATAMPGYVLRGWEGLPDLGTAESIQATLAEAATITAVFARAQPAHDLASGPFSLSRWTDTTPLGTRIDQTSQPDPKLDTPLESTWALPFNLTSRSRVAALGDSGLVFQNASNPQATSGAGHLGALVLALNTTGASQVMVSWTGGTVTPASRIYGIRLQYAVGDEAFQDVVDAAGQPSEYLSADQTAHSTRFGPLALPARAVGQPFVQLRWKYYHLAGEDGPRPALRVDDILVETGGLLPGSVPGVIAAIERQADGSLLVRFRGQPKRPYRLEKSADLLAWGEGQDFTTDAAGLAEVRFGSASARGFVRVATR